MGDKFTILIERFDPTDSRLGRHVRHDSRSLDYQIEAQPIDKLQSVRHNRRISILDQGNIGSCTGNAAVGCVGTDPYFSTLAPGDQQALNERFALQIYSEATKLDTYPGTYPPTDTGSDGLAAAQAIRNHNLISGFMHATSLEAALTAIAMTPVIVGTKWLDNMFTPGPDGKLNVSGGVAGGHEYEIDEIDVENRRVWMDNSWGPWGMAGRAYLTWDDFGALLDDNGDVTVFVPKTSPPPIPTPPQPKPPSPPSPPSPPGPGPDPKAEFETAYKAFQDAALKFFGS